MAVVEGVGVLLHEEDESVEDEEDGVRPGPVPGDGQTDHAADEYELPELVSRELASRDHEEQMGEGITPPYALK